MPAQEKTEAPTPRRREELRKKGQVPVSVDFSSSFHFLSLFLALGALLPHSARKLEECFAVLWTERLPPSPDFSWASSVLRLGGSYFVQAVAPFVALALGMGVFLGFVQTGFVFSFERLRPRFDQVNPLQGMGRLFSLRTVVEFLKVALKTLLGILLAYVVLRGSLPVFGDLLGMELLEALRASGGLVRKLGLYLGGLFLAVGFFDLFYQRFEYERNIRMTKEELKEEYRRTEGDPLVKSRLRARQRELARRRMMQEVPKAQVVVTNPVHVACALRYERGKMRAPVLVAKGKRLLAERIKAIAREHGVPIVENREVAWDLYRFCEVGQEIPHFLYRAVAEILAFVYRLQAAREGRSL
ncbi:flagellar biosynthesis protein FlhB [Candidatus Caldatribacterium sp. SIUC1]|uniref:flagellar biosynthesis protein FlhB n=1 Tax=Candidatus Caldatribacterium sp. SIUC1 TaxID=3418365 RepID=UPI003F690239